MSPGTRFDQSPAYAEPGYAMNVTLEIRVASNDNPVAHPGIDRFATKYRSVEFCRRENRSPIDTSAAM
jgi:hypothetical protein